MEIGNKVIDENGYYGFITNIFEATGQIQVKQVGRLRTNYHWDNVICTYDNKKQLKLYNN